MDTITKASKPRKSVNIEQSKRAADWIPLHGDSLRWILPVAGLVIALEVLWRVYEWQFAWKYGLDSTSASFRTYWHGLLFFNLALITFGGGAALAWLMRGCRTCAEHRDTYGEVLPAHEIGHVWRVWAGIAGFAVSLYGFAYFAEQDAAWHQVTIRDTAFTPSHTVLFWGIAPLAVLIAACIYVYAVTRLPKIYAKGVPLSLALFFTGVFLLFVWVAFNEWGHSFWIAEELFSAPLHWGFVAFAFMAFGLIGVFTQTLSRVIDIMKTTVASEQLGSGLPAGVVDGPVAKSEPSPLGA